MVVDELPQLIDDVGVDGRHRSDGVSSEKVERECKRIEES